jgi:alpha-D-ribose 1-methylphosphonate 5-triphosphate synthase subunit PhnL
MHHKYYVSNGHLKVNKFEKKMSLLESPYKVVQIKAMYRGYISKKIRQFTVAFTHSTLMQH